MLVISENALEMVAVEFVVATDFCGQRLDEFLLPRLPLLSRTKLKVLLASGSVSRNGSPGNPGTRLRAGDRIHVQWNPAKLPPLPPEPAPIEILWQDAGLVAVNKPAGMLMHPTMGVKRGTLAGVLLARWNPWLREGHLVQPEGCPVIWPHFVHRLDRETSGVVLAAQDSSTAKALSIHLARGGFRKEYLAILEGEAPYGELLVDKAIARVSDVAPHWRVSSEGATAASRIRILHHTQGLSLAVMRPITGRTNQLRIHAAHLGFPILGDVAYGASAAPRLFLHARRLGFPHPSDASMVTVSAPIPEPFKTFWPASRDLPALLI